ncbi:MAG: tetratricopeptide repeat protein [Bacteriovoracaceae bacterium]|nr:tetratricopeptide repeat protein [Bacteriovoracaceae bacterium]
MKSLKYYILMYIAFLFFFLTAGFINKNTPKPEINIAKQISATNIKSEILSIFSLGQKRLLSDFFWIVTLIESDTEHYNLKDKNSWMFLRFNTITNLDPLFLKAYQFAGKYLNVVKDDLEGARYIFKKGLKYYPNDFELLYNYAFLLAFELQELEPSYQIYKKLLYHPKSPPLIKSLANKILFSINNDLELMYDIVKDMYEREPKDSPVKEKLRYDLYTIKAELDLKCLNSNKENCQTTDLYGQPYIRDKNGYRTKNEFLKFKFHKKE